MEETKVGNDNVGFGGISNFVDALVYPDCFSKNGKGEICSDLLKNVSGRNVGSQFRVGEVFDVSF